jgi:hypothetical protein
MRTRREEVALPESISATAQSPSALFSRVTGRANLSPNADSFNTSDAGTAPRYSAQDRDACPKPGGCIIKPNR